MLERLKRWAAWLKREIVVLYLACREPRVPWIAKALALLTVAYALSPIDLIPDFIPIIGYLDDLVILPLLILSTLRTIPVGIMAELRQAATRREGPLPGSRAGAIGIVAVWLLLALWLGWWLLRPTVG